MLVSSFPALVTPCCCPYSALNVSRMQLRYKGHSKWQNIKYKKAHIDFARSKEFGKLSMEIITAVRGESEVIFYAVLCEINNLSHCLTEKVKMVRVDSVRPANSHGFTVRLTVWGINSRSHDLASKSHGESENLEIDCQTIQVVGNNIEKPC